MGFVLGWETRLRAGEEGRGDSLFGGGWRWASSWAASGMCVCGEEEKGWNVLIIQTSRQGFDVLTHSASCGNDEQEVGKRTKRAEVARSPNQDT